MLPDQRELHAQLSGRELEVFHLLVMGKRVNEIADQLIISNKTVSTHKLNLMEKMKLGSTADLVRYAVQHGLFQT
jgi:DNA-binding NarL/FixJ family response regulator